MMEADERAVKLLVGVARGILRFVENKASDIATLYFTFAKDSLSKGKLICRFVYNQLSEEMDIKNWLNSPGILFTFADGKTDDITFSIGLRLALLIASNAQDIPHFVVADLPPDVHVNFVSAFYKIMVDRMFEGE